MSEFPDPWRAAGTPSSRPASAVGSGRAPGDLTLGRRRGPHVVRLLADARGERGLLLEVPTPRLGGDRLLHRLVLDPVVDLRHARGLGPLPPGRAHVPDRVRERI